MREYGLLFLYGRIRVTENPYSHFGKWATLLCSQLNWRKFYCYLYSKFRFTYIRLTESACNVKSTNSFQCNKIHF